MVDSMLEQKTGAENVVWDLSIFYSGPDDPAIEQDIKALNNTIDAFVGKYRGRITQLSSAELLEAMHEIESLTDSAYRLGMFANLLYASDTTNPQYGALMQRLTEFDAELDQKMLFFQLEWLDMDDAAADKLLAEPSLSRFKHYLEAERRYKPYKLSEIEEQILVEKSVTGRNSWTRFFSQLMGITRFDYEGEKLTQSQVLSKLYDTDREVRRKAADSITAVLRERSMELTYIFNVLAADKFQEDKRRGYSTWISSRNLSNKVADEVVDALVQAVTSNYDIVARHYNLKRILLGYDELTEYDRYAPLPMKASDRLFSWDEAREIVQTAYQAFNPGMAEISQKFFDNNWIHSALHPGKRGGAFSAGGPPSAHPFILMNYTGRERDISTLAHELGHGVHQYLASSTQGILNASTPLTTAEMASTFGEMLVFNDLMQREPDPQARLAMLAQKIEDAFATVFRQTAMNRFEDGLHTARRTEGELTSERIGQIWIETQRAMFKGSVNLRDDYAAWWSYIPHFLHTPGYVYAYAFGELLVLALFNIYQERGADFVPAYLDVLAAGGSDWPDQILSKVGVDLTDLNFWNEGLNILRDMVAQEEALAREVYPEKFA
jgi:oligoendopeptidase F